MEIFQGDGEKVDKLNEILCEKAGFLSCYSISTQSKFTLKTLNIRQCCDADCSRKCLKGLGAAMISID